MNGARPATVVWWLCVLVSPLPPPAAGRTFAQLTYARETFDGDRTVSVNGLYENDADAARVASVDEYAERRPHLTYAAMQCVYADGVADALRAFYGALSRVLSSSCGDGLSVVLAELDRTKPLFEKMAYNMLYYLDQLPRLRTGDPGLLKTVLSVILFLQYHRKNRPFAVRGPDAGDTLYSLHALSNSVVQTVGLVERFRYKHCLVTDPNANRDEIGRLLTADPQLGEIDAIRTVLKSKTDRLEFSVGEGPVTYDGHSYAPDMYDPGNFLLASLFDGHGGLLANATMPIFDRYVGPFRKLYETALEAYDIETIAKYQNRLLELIAHVFARKIHNYLKEPGDERVLGDLKSAFDTFTRDVLPANCDLDVCGFVFGVSDNVNVSFDSILFGLDRNVEQQPKVTDDTIAALRSVFHGKFWKSEDQIDIVNNMQLSHLMREITQNGAFKVFRQVVRLLSHESNTNCNYLILKLHDYPELPRTDRRLVSMTQLQSALFSLWEKGLNNTNTDAKQLLLNTTRYVINVYTEFDGVHDLRNIILPLLIHLRYVNNNFASFKPFDFVRLEHMLWFTITVIENYLFRQYQWLMVNAVYSVLDLKKSKNSLLEKIIPQDAHVTIEELNEYLDNLYGKLYSNNGLPSSNVEKIQFYWNGAYKAVDKIFLEAPLAIIDIQDLINHRLLAIKWFWAKFLLKLKYYTVTSLQMKKYSFFMHWSEILAVGLRDLMSSDIPFKSKKCFGPIVDLFVSIINQNDMPPQTYSDFIRYTDSVFEKSLLSLGATTDKEASNSIIIMNPIIHDDLDELKKMLSTIQNENELLPLSETISISIALIPI